MPAKCFVCDLPILSHQVGLIWQGGHGVDDFLREQMDMVSRPFKPCYSYVKAILTVINVSLYL